jgi:hypothetical protein
MHQFQFQPIPRIGIGTFLAAMRKRSENLRLFFYGIILFEKIVHALPFSTGDLQSPKIVE